ncbi:MAG: sugar-transfer associated ATP-grasp domain-containing protein [Stellaceae bacterium]
MAVLDRAAAKGSHAPTLPAEAPRRGFVRRRFGKYLALGQYGFPFSWGPYPTPVARFRAVARRTRFARHDRVRVFTNTAMALGWPIGALTTALRTCRDARARGRTYGWRQFVDMYRLALRYSIPPLEYVLYHFEEPARRRDMHQYVYWNDLPGLAALNARRGADNRDVQDKDRFAEICATHGFPHVPTLAVFDNGRQTYPAAPFVPEAPVLWTKSLRLKGGAGGAKWIKDADVYRDKDGHAIRAGNLGDAFRKEDCLVQPFIDNHPDIARVSNGALASLRIVTGMNEAGATEFVTAMLGLPHGPRTTSIAAICCSIDLAKGRIRQAELHGGEPIADHPDTGAPIVGIVLPFWRESIDLVCRAHAAAFPRFAFLGWDVALTMDGPILLETNSGWGALFHQMLDGPLGHTAFSRLVSQYV